MTRSSTKPHSYPDSISTILIRCVCGHWRNVSPSWGNSRRQAVTSFLVARDPAAEVAVFQYVRHIFGSKNSPTCANYAMRRTATDNASQFPEAAQSVINTFYVDDYLESSTTIEEAARKAKDLLKLLSLCGFKLTKFVSNVPTIPPQVETNSTSPTETKEIPSTEESSHVLGLKWNHSSDTLLVSCGTNPEVKTKVLQRIRFEFSLFSARSDRTCRAVYR